MSASATLLLLLCCAGALVLARSSQQEAARKNNKIGVSANIMRRFLAGIRDNPSRRMEMS